MSERCTDVCFTINNPNDIEGGRWIRTLDPNLVLYAIVQLERGHSGTLHYQGFAILKKQSRFSALNGKDCIFEGAALFKRSVNATRDQARDYCKKVDDTYVAGL